VDIDEGHAAGKAGDDFRDALLHAGPSFLLLPLASQGADIALKNGREARGLSWRGAWAILTSVRTMLHITLRHGDVLSQASPGLNKNDRSCEEFRNVICRYETSGVTYGLERRTPTDETFGAGLSLEASLQGLLLRLDPLQPPLGRAFA
jgi:hypothetical protein